MENLLILISSHPDPIHATKQWRKQARGGILCPECTSIRRSQFPTPVDIVLRERPEQTICEPIWWTGVSIFHRDFIEQIRKHMGRFTFGKCFLEDGTVVEEYVTCYSRDYIVIRGTAESEYGICSTCGTTTSMGHFPHCIPEFYLKYGPIYQDGSGNMLIDEALFCEMELSPWRGLFEFDRIPVRPEPLDGQHLPIDPPMSLLH